MWEGTEGVEWLSCYNCKVGHREVLDDGAMK